MSLDTRHATPRRRHDDKIVGLFCRIMSLLQCFFTKETYNFIEIVPHIHDSFIMSHVTYESHLHVYGVATISRTLKTIGLFWKRAL